MNKGQRYLVAAGLLSSVLGLWGCQSGPRAATDSGRPVRSLVFNAPGIQGGPHRTGAPGPRPWYETRKDQGPVVYAGVRGVTVEHSVSFTYDRQAQHGGHVRDHFHSTTLRRSITTTVR